MQELCMTKTNKKNQKNGTSNIKSISEVSKKYKNRQNLLDENTELQQFVAAQELKVSKLEDKIKQKDAEIAHLKEMLATSVPVLDKVERIEVQDEEMIAEMQLQKLKSLAQNRELTLEEARKFEIYSKIKQNVNKNRTITPQFQRLPDNTSKTDLLQIAGTKLDDKKVRDES